jgi:vesicle coat complex subunit
VPGYRPGGLDYKELIPPLIDALKDSDTEVRQSAVGALASMGHQAVPALVEVLKDKDKDKELRANVAYVLGQMGTGGQEAVPALVKLLKDDDTHVRRRAAYAIQSIVKASGEPGPGMMPGMPGGPGLGYPGGYGPRPGGPPAPAVHVADPGIVPAPGGSGAQPTPGRTEPKKEDKK